MAKPRTQRYLSTSSCNAILLKDSGHLVLPFLHHPSVDIDSVALKLELVVVGVVY